VNVRAASEADVDQLTQIWYGGWHDAHARIVPAELTRLRTLTSFRDRLHTGMDAVRVVEASGSVVGFSMIRGAELYQFYVAASWRGSGAAPILMADAEARFAERGIDVAWLACATGNDRAARFYEKCGWTRAGTSINNADTTDGPFPLKVWRYEKSLSLPRNTPNVTRSGAR
jgi:ribosomal protein S18 acetylase RimI-like enzyme